MTQMLVPVLAFFSVVALGAAVLVVRSVRQRMLEIRLYGQHVTASDAATVARGAGLTGVIDHIGRAVSRSRMPQGLAEKLVRAGYYDQAAPGIYVGTQLLLVLLGLAFGAVLAYGLAESLFLRGVLLIFCVAVLAMLPNLVIVLRQHRRSAEVRRALPDAVDLMEICVSSGMGLDMAWNAVADEIRRISPVLADEMALANLEIHLGSPRADSLRHMADRTAVHDINTLVATLVQSERFGTSVSQALRIYADAMRSERSQRAEEAAEKLMVKLLFPMVLFIFPCMFIVILGPAALQIAKMLSNG